MTIDDLAGKKILLMGLGVLGGGEGVAKFLAQASAKVTVTDLKSERQLSASLRKLTGFRIDYVLGRHKEQDFRNHDLIIRNPAVPIDSPYLAIAREAGIPIEMESSLFFQLSPTKNIIGVTGTKGKTTTTLLIAKILKDAGFDVCWAGNLRISMLAILPRVKKESWVVLELSSWQLEGLLPHRISPHIGVLTNIMPDHLDRYRTMGEYIEAKKIIFKFQSREDFFVTNQEDPITRRLAHRASSHVRLFSKERLPEPILRSVKLLGEHNLSNVAASYETVSILGVSMVSVCQTLSRFQGTQHRLEEVRVLNGVRFFNDSAATTPESAVAALNTFFGGVVLICGGADKNLDFVSLGGAIKEKVKWVVLLEGSATDKIARQIPKTKIAGRFADFKEAVEKAYSFSSAGDIVLLSPACASFGMFANEFDRGVKFKKIVRML